MEIIKNFLNDIETVTSHNDKTKPLFLHEPKLNNTNANTYLQECIIDGWVSSAGQWVDKFEKKICEITKAKHAIAVTNGTDALRLSLYLVGVTGNDEVLVPSLTFVGTVNSISHLGAIPNFVDVDNKYCLSAEKLDIYLKKICEIKDAKAYNKKTGRIIKAIIPVHLFGNPAEIKKINKIAKKWNLKVVEDAAEALGSFKKNIHCGLLGDIGILSFNGNKIVTCGGGGAIITDNNIIAKKAKHLSTTAKVRHKFELFHDEIAWNDRMPNINAALGFAQLEIFENTLNKKRILLKNYEMKFSDKYPLKILSCNEEDRSNNWLITIELQANLIKDLKLFRNKLLNSAIDRNIFLRPVWKPIHTLKMYKNCPKDNLNNTMRAYRSLINLPSSPSLISDKSLY